MKAKSKYNIIFLLGMILMLCCSACGNDKSSDRVKESETKNTESMTKDVVQTEVKEETTTEITESVLTGTYKVPLHDMYIGVPDLHYMEEAYTQVFWEAQVKYATFTFLENSSATNAKEALEVTFEEFKGNMSDLHIVNNIDNVTGEELTINSIDVYAFEGTANCGSSSIYEAYVKGYGFIYDGMACSIIGVVMDETQPQEQIDAVKEIVDAMILTVRNTQ